MTLEDAIVVWLAFEGDPDIEEHSPFTVAFLEEAREVIWKQGCKLRKARKDSIIDDA